ncbi:uroporphyrinogen-III synthase [Sanguibacter keddieii DSM 10542]|uniref:Uroporphyrinogen-III synthase n=1 Tax=Sanguibacter keddieii (strain ATCC 51767 / DSM 10542 / NCFB 3025 / ST-74) TaxID=446469 RepID=D1BFI9_SANKS|nr:uroporphyrinogen-III synthase [Sanguibacter keddieii]ACZ23492.1 uroporphyrinogen-III synthase [Sanguibacter keddieii DSM 10542]
MDRPDQPSTQAAGVTAARPLEGWHVLVPRAPGRGAGLARLVEAAGGTAVVAPLVSRAEIGPEDQATLDAAVAGLRDGHVAWVAVTSVNAVDELVASARRVGGVTDGETGDATSSEDDGTGHDDSAPGTHSGALAAVARRARWAAVGPATARALAAVGISVDLVATENSAVGLLAEWPAVPGPQPTATATATDVPATDTPPPVSPPASAPRVLLPLGDLARPTLEVGLRERGYEPVRVTTYRTVSHPAPGDVVTDWRDGAYDAVVLTSGSVAREVAGQLGPHSDVRAVAIGEPTRRAAVETGQAVTAVARTADDDGLLAALVAARRTSEVAETTESTDASAASPQPPP